MKLREIFCFEFAYQIRRPWTWLYIVVLIAVNFLMTRDNAAAHALPDDLMVNSPFLIVTTTVVGTLLWLMMAAAVAGDAASRDVSTSMYPLIYSLSVSKAEYLGGRFLAAFFLNAFILLSVQAGILLALFMPGIDPESVGPFRPAAHVSAYAIISLPNAFFATAIQFLLATRSGRAMPGYFGSFLLFFMGFFVASFLLYKKGLGTLLDPIGIRFIVEDIAHMWTTIEKRNRLLGMEGIVLTNRAFWLTIGFIALAVTYLSFRFAHRTEKIWRWRRVRSSSNQIDSDLAYSDFSLTVKRPEDDVKAFGFFAQVRQMLAIAGSSFMSIAKSWAGLFLLIAIPVMTIPVIADQMNFNGVPLLPTTARVISELTAPLSSELSRWVVIPAIIIFFAGELVWKEREAGLGEIIDAMPGSEWAPLLGKFIGLSLVLTLFTALQMISAIIAQSLLGYHQFEVGLYLKILFGLQLSEYLLFAMLSLALHVIVNQKYTGHLVGVIAYVFIALPNLFGVEHNLLVYGSGPGWSYTEMRGFTPHLYPWMWFKAYWVAWALFLAVTARILWVRGKESAFGLRMREARLRFAGPTRWTTGIALILILSLGGYIFLNTNILNPYLTSAERKERAAEYERRYSSFEHTPQPELTRATLHVELYPQQLKAEIRGVYSLTNRTGFAIDSIHVATIPEVETITTLEHPSHPILIDEELGYRIYALHTPLLPGDSLSLNFELNIHSRGFSENGVDAAVTPNGTYFKNQNYFPSIGYQRLRELITDADRREHDLPSRPLIDFLSDENAYKSRGVGIQFEAVMGTDSGQIAVAPGMLRRSWADGSRSYFHYATDAGPNSAIGFEWAFFSANYGVHEVNWSGVGQDVKIRIYHDPRHTRHLDRAVESIRASLDYYTSQFGPYRYKYLTVVERPGLGVGMHADASMIVHAEGFTQWDPREGDGGHDHPFAIVTHEMAHQWTVPFAFVEGAPVMSESLAWYYGMKAVENSKGVEGLRRLLRFMWQPHPYSPILRGEPLLRGVDPYMSYRKGPFALYTLSEYIGDDRVNAALHSLLQNHEKPNAPLATTLDLYAELEMVTPDTLKYLLHDLFAVNTSWKLDTKEAVATKHSSGNWQVILKVEAHKIVIDSTGIRREVPLDEWMNIGAFGHQDDGISQQPLYLKKHRIRSGSQTIKFTTSSPPFRAGIDPYHVINWEERSEENIENVKLQ